MVPTRMTTSFPDGSTPTVAVIGAGISGLCAAIQLQRQLQLSTYTVFELEADVGGTWFTTRYPGLSIDAPSHLYNYSFAPNFDWSQKFVPGREVLEYFQKTARVYNIYDKIRFNTRVDRLEWNESRSKWVLRWTNTATGHQGRLEADIVIQGAGVLRIPKIPTELKGFEGPMWHSARWDDSVDLADKRVGVVGSGASAVQIIPEIADKVHSLHVYGRTATYITPVLNTTYSPMVKALFRHVPYFHALYVAFLYYYVDSTILLYHKLAWFSVLHRMFVYFVTWLHRFRQVPDPVTRRKLTPPYELASRRIALSDTFYPTFSRPNVSLHADAITSVKGHTIQTEDGSTTELDVLVLATGYDWLPNYPTGYLIGRDGTDIFARWNGSPVTYYGTCVPSAPNFYLVWGPNTGIAHHSLTSIVEIQVDYIMRSLSYMMRKNLGSMEVKQEAAEEFLEILDKRISRTVFTTKVMPKYTGPDGKCRGFWWGSCTMLWWQLRHLYPERFLLRGRREVPAKGAAFLNGSASLSEHAAIEH